MRLSEGFDEGAKEGLQVKNGIDMFLFHHLLHI